ncbi:MAG: hypothetical protein M3O68_07075 [Thermoproteota archaeon]|nr:hypothetical protein [Thermoproteota archaeon]
MKYTKGEIQDFQCRLCGTRWLAYIKNNNSCPTSVQGDGRYSFEFGKPIKRDKREKEPSTSDVKLQEGKITFQ